MSQKNGTKNNTETSGFFLSAEILLSSQQRGLGAQSSCPAWPPQAELGGSCGVSAIRDATFLRTTPSTPTASTRKHQRLSKARVAASSAQGTSRVPASGCYPQSPSRTHTLTHRRTPPPARNAAYPKPQVPPSIPRGRGGTPGGARSRPPAEEQRWGCGDEPAPAGAGAALPARCRSRCRWRCRSGRAAARSARVPQAPPRRAGRDRACAPHRAGLRAEPAPGHGTGARHRAGLRAEPGHGTATGARHHAGLRAEPAPPPGHGTEPLQGAVPGTALGTAREAGMGIIEPALGTGNGVGNWTANRHRELSVGMGTGAPHCWELWSLLGMGAGTTREWEMGTVPAGAGPGSGDQSGELGTLLGAGIQIQHYPGTKTRDHPENVPISGNRSWHRSG